MLMFVCGFSAEISFNHYHWTYINIEESNDGKRVRACKFDSWVDVFEILYLNKVKFTYVVLVLIFNCLIFQFFKPIRSFIDLTIAEFLSKIACKFNFFLPIYIYIIWIIKQLALPNWRSLLLFCLKVMSMFIMLLFAYALVFQVLLTSSSNVSI